MKNLREAAQQALEAMNKATGYMKDADYVRLNQAIDTLRAALAEPEPKPVAYVTGVYGGHFTVAPVDPSVVLRPNMPLYTHPAARVPLTEDEIFALVRPHWDSVRNARAIERAHGIGEKE